jgi:hypothetical protein
MTITTVAVGTNSTNSSIISDAVPSSRTAAATAGHVDGLSSTCAALSSVAVPIPDPPPPSLTEAATGEVGAAPDVAAADVESSPALDPTPLPMATSLASTGTVVAATSRQTSNSLSANAAVGASSDEDASDTVASRTTTSATTTASSYAAPTDKQKRKEWIKQKMKQYNSFKWKSLREQREWYMKLKRDHPECFSVRIDTKQSDWKLLASEAYENELFTHPNNIKNLASIPNRALPTMMRNATVQAKTKRPWIESYQLVRDYLNNNNGRLEGISQELYDWIRFQRCRHLTLNRRSLMAKIPRLQGTAGRVDDEKFLRNVQAVMDRRRGNIDIECKSQLWWFLKNQRRTYTPFIKGLPRPKNGGYISSFRFRYLHELFADKDCSIQQMKEIEQIGVDKFFEKQQEAIKLLERQQDDDDSDNKEDDEEEDEEEDGSDSGDENHKDEDYDEDVDKCEEGCNNRRLPRRHRRRRSVVPSYKDIGDSEEDDDSADSDDDDGPFNEADDDDDDERNVSTNFQLVATSVAAAASSSDAAIVNHQTTTLGGDADGADTADDLDGMTMGQIKKHVVALRARIRQLEAESHAVLHRRTSPAAGVASTMDSSFTSTNRTKNPDGNNPQPRSRTTTAAIAPKYSVESTKFYKKFNDDDGTCYCWYEGTVTKFDSTTRLYSITYSDGDHEDLSEVELTRQIRISSRAVAAATVASSSSSVSNSTDNENPFYFIGTTFVKRFDGHGDFVGRVVGYCCHRKNNMYRVKYEDDDEEDSPKEQIVPYINDASATAASNADSTKKVTTKKTNSKTKKRKRL